MRRFLLLSSLLLAAAAAGPAAAAGGDGFLVDVAAGTGLDFVHFNGMSGELYFPEMTGGGAALLDYDGDGDLDVYLVQGAMLGEGVGVDAATIPPRHPQPLTDRLYRNDLHRGPDGRTVVTFTDVTEAAGLARPGVADGYGMGVAAGDFDGDGRVDLYVTNFGSNRLLRNTGDGRFEDVTAASGTDDDRWSVAAVFFDLDRDGLLDLYVGNYVDYRLATHKPCTSPSGALDYCGPRSYPPETDRLFGNLGGGRFEDATERAGLSEAAGAALGAVTGDFDGDGRIDLYVANDGSANFLWLARADATLSDEALLGGTAVNEEGMPEASMGVVAGDLDGDGSEDLFMSHLTRETNTFYANDGTGLFADRSRASGLGNPSWAWTGFGVAAFDYDGDGGLDLYVGNGAVKLMEEQMRAGRLYPLEQPDQLFRNLGGGRFEETTGAAGPDVTVEAVTRGVAAGDIDLDGDPDLVVVDNAGPVRLLENRTPASHWLGVDLVSGTEAPRPLLGARLALSSGEASGAPTLVRRVRSDGSYASAGDPRVLFGLGGGPTAGLSLEVRWPDGPVGTPPTVWRGLAAGRYLRLPRPPATRAPETSAPESPAAGATGGGSP